jgi:hypothetical protein
MQTEVQLLDNEALKYIKTRRAEGCLGTTLSKELTDLGYTTKTGLRIDPPALSKFANDNGLRDRKPYKKGANRVKEVSFNQDKVMAVISAALNKGKEASYIARKLNKEGYTTKRGKKWARIHVYDYIRLMRQNQANTVSFEGKPLPEMTPQPVKGTDDITAIVRSDLPKHLKLKILSEYL